MIVKLACGIVFHSVCPVWLSSGPPESFPFCDCTWLWNWLIVISTPHTSTSCFYSLFTLFPDTLIEAIHQDIKDAQELLEQAENKSFATHTFFTETESKNGAGETTWKWCHSLHEILRTLEQDMPCLMKYSGYSGMVLKERHTKQGKYIHL